MFVRVITPPDPIVTPADIVGDHAPDDSAVAAMIQAVTEEIDGPGGWLGRSLGPQTLEWSGACWPSNWLRLPYGPVADIDGVSYLDANGEEQEVDGGDWSYEGGLLIFREGWSAPSLFRHPAAVKITYQAGYDGEDITSDGTGPVPERARQAIILSVQHMLSLGAENLFRRAEEVEGIGRDEFTLSDVASKIVSQACDRLLSTLRVYA